MARTTKVTGANQAVAYYRVSTQKQGASGLGLDAQRAQVATFAKGRGMSIIAEFIEIESGRKNARPKLAEAMKRANDTGATLLIAKLDRLSRNVAFIAALMESKTRFIAVDMPEVDSLTLHVLAAVAQREAEMTSTRTKAALAQAKARGIKLGTPANMNHAAQIKGAHANKDAAKAAYSKQLAYVCDMRRAGMTLATIADRLNSDGYRTRGGAMFTKATVQRMLERAKA